MRESVVMTEYEETAALKARVAEQDEIDARFERLEAKIADGTQENEQLKAKVAALEALQGRKVLPPPRPIEEGTKVSYPIAPSKCVVPTDEELSQLREIVCRKYPEFGDITGPAFYGSKYERERDWQKQFERAFLALGAMKRLEAPDTKHYFSHHVDAAEAYLRSVGKSETLRFGPFMCALLAWGDVPYSGLGLQHTGAVVELGLSEHIGRQASDSSWKRVLETGAILRMSASARQPAPRSPSRVIVQDHGGW
jgi:hypothetical protein